MNKQEWIEEIAGLTKLTKSDCLKVVDSALELLRQKVKKGEEVRLVGFGTFLKSKRSARKGRNPRTGEELKIKAQFVPKFRAGKDFKEFLA